MKTYNQVEGILYNHYEKKKKRDRFKSSLIRTELRIENIREDLRNCNFILNEDMQGIDYSKEMLGGGDNTISSMEKNLIREETKLEMELEQEIKYKINIKRKIRNIQKQIDNIEIILEQLPVNYIQVIELIYKDKLTHRGTGYILNCDSSTVSRNRRDIVNELKNKL